jgi:uncharacterized protein YndB with AHSA1/START domain
VNILLALLLAAAPAVILPGPAARMIVEADGTRTLVHETIVDAPAAKVWQAISTAEGWRGWAAPVARFVGEDLLETSYDPGAPVGGPQMIRQQIVARIPGRMLVFRTVKAPAGFPDFETFAKVVNVIELVPQGEGRTLVRLTGTNYPDDEAGRRLFAFFQRGNGLTLAKLQALFAPNPAPER